MESLQKIQKTFGVFQVLSKVAMILSFVWAGLALIGLLFGIVWYTGGSVYGANMETVISLTETGGLYEMIGTLLSDFVFALTDGVLYLFAWNYFKAEQADGTPFTVSGANRIRRLGIQTIVLPLVAVIVSSVIYTCFGMASAADSSNAGSVVLGIMLILVSLVFQYGAELEKNRRQ